MAVQGRITAGELTALVDASGVSARKVAQALGVAEARLSEWRHGTPTRRLRYTHEEAERAVAVAGGQVPAPTLDVRSYVAGLLVNLEGSAEHQLATIREARAALGLSAATLPDVVARERESRADLDAVRPAAAAPARRRRGG